MCFKNKFIIYTIFLLIILFIPYIYSAEISKGKKQLMKKNIETIFTHITDEGIEGRLGIDENGKLYWNDQVVITAQKTTLQWWVDLSENGTLVPRTT